MFEITARLVGLINPNDLAQLLGFDARGEVQWALTQSFIDHCNSRLPASPDRTLEFSAVNDYTRAIWNTPYAHYHYIGLVRTDENGRTWVGPGETKPVLHDDWQMEYDRAQNPEAGPYWPERTVAADIADILRETAAVAQKHMRGG